jgi:hypothetical protein
MIFPNPQTHWKTQREPFFALAVIHAMGCSEPAKAMTGRDVNLAQTAAR